MTTDRQLDDAIDRAVRELMSVDPPAGLRARVLARLERPRRVWVTVPRLAAAAALAAAVLIAFVLFREGTTPPKDVQVAVQSAEPVRPTPDRPIAKDAPVAPPPAGVPSPGVVRTPPLTPQPSFAGRAVVAASVRAVFVTDVEPLEALPPIALEPIAPAPIRSAAIVVDPLPAIAPLEVPSLPPPDERD